MSSRRVILVILSFLCVLGSNVLSRNAVADVIEFDDLGSSTGVGVMDEELYGGGKTWLAYNGTGEPGRGNGQTGSSTDASARGMYIYPFAHSDPNNFPGSHTPLLANVKPLEVADQFELSDYSGIEFYWENIEFFGAFSALHWVLNVDGTWYFQNDLTWSADSVSGDNDGDDSARVAFDPSASKWTELLLGPTSYYRSKGTEDADFDDNDEVSGSDFLIWQRGFGSSGAGNNAEGNANQEIHPVGARDDDVNSLDLALWEDHYANPFDPNAPAPPIDIDTIAVGSAAGSDLTGTVQGYGFFLQASELTTSPPFVQGTDILEVGIEGTPIPLSGVGAVPEPAAAVLALMGIACMGRVGAARRKMRRCL